MVVLAYLGMCGCLPTRYTYQRIDVPDARYFKPTCYASVGPPSVAYYPLHGIFISLDVTDLITLALHLPAGNTVMLNGNAVRIVGSADSGPIDTTIPIRAARHEVDRREFSDLPDPFTSADNFGPLTGETDHGRFRWYSFLSESSASPPRVTGSPRGLIRGTVELPSITINGQSYGAQVLPFERRVHYGIFPLNC